MQQESRGSNEEESAVVAERTQTQVHLSSAAEGCAAAAEGAALRVRVTSAGRIVFRVAAQRVESTIGSEKTSNGIELCTG